MGSLIEPVLPLILLLGFHSKALFYMSTLTEKAYKFSLRDS
jgi:hypothetical protein